MRLQSRKPGVSTERNFAYGIVEQMKPKKSVRDALNRPENGERRDITP
jgi:hypothetical protein